MSHLNTWAILCRKCTTKSLDLKPPFCMCQPKVVNRWPVDELPWRAGSPPRLPDKIS